MWVCVNWLPVHYHWYAIMLPEAFRILVLIPEVLTPLQLWDTPGLFPQMKRGRELKLATSSAEIKNSEATSLVAVMPSLPVQGQLYHFPTHASTCFPFSTDCFIHHNSCLCL
jgi:hypothetical protein